MAGDRRSVPGSTYCYSTNDHTVVLNYCTFCSSVHVLENSANIRQFWGKTAPRTNFLGRNLDGTWRIIKIDLVRGRRQFSASTAGILPHDKLHRSYPV